jgi:hypothetical protein
MEGIQKSLYLAHDLSSRTTGYLVADLGVGIVADVMDCLGNDLRNFVRPVKILNKYDEPCVNRI